jgi:hypothetical protein
MPRADYKHCKCCLRHVEECGELTHSRYCSDCWPVIQVTHNHSMHLHERAHMLDWRRRMARAIGAVLLDDLPTAP